eukprot:Skav227444  [mRNA]  locus=scaffold2491:58547:66590:+ [translate_table: standard]
MPCSLGTVALRERAYAGLQAGGAPTAPAALAAATAPTVPQAAPVAQPAALDATECVGQLAHISVNGCTHATVGGIVRGNFTANGQNHGRPTYRKELGGSQCWGEVLRRLPGADLDPAVGLFGHWMRSRIIK